MLKFNKLKNTYKLKVDKMFFKSFEEQPYPIGIHVLNLDLEVDYIVGLGQQFQKDSKKLTCDVCDMRRVVKDQINGYIAQNKNSDGHDMRIFYLMMKTAIEILLIYYNEDGTRKHINRDVVL